MKKKNVLCAFVKVVFCSMLIISLVLFFYSAPAIATKSKPYKIGVTQALSGFAASMGTASRNAVLMRIDEINRNGGINGHKLTSVIYDNRSDNSTAVLNVRKLIERDKVDALIVGATSGAGFGALGISERLKTPMFSIAAAIKLWKPTKPFSFDVVPGADLQEKARARWIKKKGFKRVGLLWLSGAYSEECVEHFEKEAGNFGLTIVANEKYKGSDTDMTVQLNKIVAAKPDVIWVTGYAHPASILAKNVRSLGIDIPILGCYAFTTATWIKLSEGAAEGWHGCIVAHQLGEATPPWRSTYPIVKAYAQSYKKRFKEGITNTSGTTYDSVSVISAGLKDLGEEPDLTKRRIKLAHAIENLRNYFYCLAGPYYFSPDNHNGTGEWAVAIVKIVDGKMVLD